MDDAKDWWEQRRPAGWSLEQHLSHRTVNYTSGYETGLAHADGKHDALRRLMHQGAALLPARWPSAGSASTSKETMAA
jgi:hypothetical protein